MNKIRDLTLLWVVVILGFVVFAHADLVWVTPLGTIGIPVKATEALIGYDAVLKQAIGGFSLPVYTDPKGFVALQVGAVAPWQTNGPTIEPYLGLGHDILREIPGLAEYKSCHVNIFGRYASNQGKAGLGVSFSYAFAGGSLPVTNPPPDKSN